MLKSLSVFVVAVLLPSAVCAQGVWPQTGSPVAPIYIVPGSAVNGAGTVTSTLCFDITSAGDTCLVRDAANTLAQRNGTTAQVFNLYNTYTNSTNYERVTLNWSSTANALTFGTEMNGTGLGRGILFRIGGTNVWQLSSSGHLLAQTDNTYDIGASGATRPRAGYFGTQVTAPFHNGNSSSIIASATTIAPTGNIHHISGTTAIATITVPAGCTPTCQITLIPDGLWTTTTAGNISLASTAVVNKALILTWDGTKWNPSY
jgi:hypothetical protein